MSAGRRHKLVPLALQKAAVPTPATPNIKPVDATAVTAPIAVCTQFTGM